MKITHTHTHTSKFFIVPHPSPCTFKIKFFFEICHFWFRIETRFARLRFKTHVVTIKNTRSIPSDFLLSVPLEKKQKAYSSADGCLARVGTKRIKRLHCSWGLRTGDERVALENQLVVSVVPPRSAIVVTKRIHVRRILVSDVRAIRTRPTILLD